RRSTSRFGRSAKRLLRRIWPNEQPFSQTRATANPLHRRPPERQKNRHVRRPGHPLLQRRPQGQIKKERGREAVLVAMQSCPVAHNSSASSSKTSLAKRSKNIRR